jgi:RNA recognition motif-containing protein
LPATITEAEVAPMFSSYGTVVSLKMLRKTRETESAVMVNYSTASEASYALQSLNGQALYEGGKPLIVKLASSGAHASPAPAPAPTPAPTQPTPRQDAAPCDNVWVGNLPPAFTQADLNALFSTYGTVIQCTILNRARETSAPVVAGMVRYASVPQAACAVATLNGHKLHPAGPALDVRFAAPKYNAPKFGHASAPSPYASRYHPYQ